MTLTIRFQTIDNKIATAHHIVQIPADARFVWYDFNQPSEDENKLLATHFKFNQLEIDDTVNETPRAKYKTYQTYQYLVMHGIRSADLGPKALNIFIQHNVLVTYHHETHQVLESIVDYMQTNRNEQLISAHMVLKILDSLIDDYFDYTYNIEDKVYEFEDTQVNGVSNQQIMDDVFKLRSDVIKLKRLVYPMQTLIIDLKEDQVLFTDHQSELYKQHVEDHIIKQENILKVSQEMTNEIRENYVSYTSYKMNKIMEVLTLVSMVFLPLTLIAGIYGMNFRYMPELNWHYGYFIVLSIMLIITIVCIWYFKKKRWF
ncbi:magnesium/cobalt transporter CorA [Staphylococcus arlettae]|uniref:magnesium/cobalt transporter CorA n=1 Tax=Staphylococcus arlettae TaxID=29378 RepID=UPI0021D23BA0|nr:magnesium/cobalt transporter CorA [Staphylococcus arlettae]MDT3895439.1 magnesium/cobalt transporter CorA [Staphylococcus arlettae]UXU50481.1 magnesium/cobalt transporter CorA [Staphylococcus arlettae]